MPSNDESVEIVICLGSSCFARGNSENLEILNKYVQRHGFNARLRLTGHLCQDECKQGPNVMIGGELHHDVTASKLCDLLQNLSSCSRGDYGTT